MLLLFCLLLDSKLQCKHKNFINSNNPPLNKLIMSHNYGSSLASHHEAPVVSAALHHVLFPLIEEVCHSDPATGNQLKQAFVKAERLGANFSNDFIHGVIPKHGANVHQTEALLRLAARPCTKR